MTTSSPAANKGKAVKKNGNRSSADAISNRKAYKSKATGQAATQTGQQATGTIGSHSNLPKNAGHQKTK